MSYDNEGENIAATILREMPKAHVALTLASALGGAVNHVAVPKGFELKALDDEQLLANPRRVKSVAQLVDAASFLAYVNDRKTPDTNVWVDFNPVEGKLSFRAVFDEHNTGQAGWRENVAAFNPQPSVEWKTWGEKNGVKQSQVGFAEFIEENDKDIAGGNGFPTSLDMMTMATNFEATSDKAFKSKVTLQGGGVEMTFVDTDNQETIQKMKVFARFQVGIPVFWTIPDADTPIAAWPLVARLKYQVSSGKVTFWYELIRPDVVYELAALALIEKIRAGLGGIPLRMGSCR